MADTLPDILLNNTAYTDLYDESGIAVGTEILVQNKGSVPVTITVVAAEPTVPDRDGVNIPMNGYVIVQAGATGAWALGSSKVNVQDNS